MTHEDYERAANHLKIKDASDEKMDRDTLLKEIEQYIKSNNTCALATGSGEFVRVTPIEYTYHDGAFWMFSEGGEKFKALEKNKNVCLAIYDKYEGFGKLKGMQVTGTAEVVDYFSEEYIAAAVYKKIPIEVLRKLPEPMNLIKVAPSKIEFLNSEFKKYGCASRQRVDVFRERQLHRDNKNRHIENPIVIVKMSAEEP